MIKKRILILMSIFILIFNNISPVFVKADSGGGGASFDTDNYEEMGDLETLADDLQEAIDSGKINPSFDMANFLGALGSSMAALTGCANPLVFGAVSGAVGAVAGDMLSDVKSIKDQQGNYGYSIGADAAGAMFDAAVKALADNSTYSAWPVILPRGYTILDLNAMQYSSGSPQIGTYPYMYGAGRDNSYPVEWYFNTNIYDTSYVWVQVFNVSNAYFDNGVYTLYAYSSDGTQNKGYSFYPTDGASANNWHYSGNYVPLITGNSFIAWTTQSDAFNVNARKETLIRNPWLDSPTLISHDSLMGTNWTEINNRNYTTINEGSFVDVSSLLAALNEQNEVMGELLLNVNEVLDTLEEIKGYTEEILNLMSKWFPNYNESDLPPLPDVSALASDYSIPDAEYSSTVYTLLFASAFGFLFLTPLFVCLVKYAFFGGD